MGFFVDELLSVNVVFKDEVLEENHFNGIVPNKKYDLIIRVRDREEGHAGQLSPHVNTVTIKLQSFNGSFHSTSGDPVPFSLNNGNLIIDRNNEAKYKNRLEKRYVENFIKHNHLNLFNY